MCVRVRYLAPSSYSILRTAKLSPTAWPPSTPIRLANLPSLCALSIPGTIHYNLLRELSLHAARRPLFMLQRKSGSYLELSSITITDHYSDDGESDLHERHVSPISRERVFQRRVFHTDKATRDRIYDTRCDLATLFPRSAFITLLKIATFEHSSMRIYSSLILLNSSELSHSYTYVTRVAHLIMAETTSQSFARADK